MENLTTTVSNIHNPCSKCVTRKNCINSSLTSEEVKHLNNLYVQKINLKKGDTLYNNGDNLLSIYNIRAGVLKTEYSLPDGRQQVVKFMMPGELAGLDGIQDGKHHENTSALTDSEICCINYDQLQKISKTFPNLQKNLDCLMSSILNEIQDHIFLLGSLSANEKLSYFLIQYSKKLASHGYSSHEFKLPMNREELSSYLGVTIETLSRAFTYMIDSNMIEASNKKIKFISNARLESLDNHGLF